jgi:hypothetical protein
VKRYYIKFSGSAFDVPAPSPELAWEQIRGHLDVYCTPTILEIGVDVDELGYPLPPKKESAK